MKAFWWFREDSIAGMARPGFNSTHWFDLPFHEAVLLGWLGRFSSGSENLGSFRIHLSEYAPKIFRFYGLDQSSGPEALKFFDSPDALKKILGQLASRTQILESFDVSGDRLHFQLSRQQLKAEVDFLKKKGIRQVVSLTERHHQAEELKNHFALQHISIEDLNAPQLEQAHQLVEILKARKGGLAVHCLAGIGRTSTMLMAAHILMGEAPEEMEALVKKQNPTFVLTGPQGDFIRSLRKK